MNLSWTIDDYHVLRTIQKRLLVSTMQRNVIQQAAQHMAAELAAQKLTVIAIPDGRENSHRGVRCVCCPNPDWYSRLCQQHLKMRLNRKWRRPRTVIRRIDTLKALYQIAQHGINEARIYHCRLMDAIEWFIQTRDFSGDYEETTTSVRCRQAEGSTEDGSDGM